MSDETMQGASETRFALCLRNEGYAASLEVRKIYPVLPATPAEQERSLIRVVDESGEDYLYPAGCFLVLELPAEARDVLLQAACSDSGLCRCGIM